MSENSRKFRERLESVVDRKDNKRSKTNYRELIRQARKLKASERNQVFNLNTLNEKPLAGE